MVVENPKGNYWKSSNVTLFPLLNLRRSHLLHLLVFKAWVGVGLVSIKKRDTYRLLLVLTRIPARNNNSYSAAGD